MESLSFAPFSIYPEYLKGGGGHHSGDNDDGGGGVPSGDVTLIVSIVETYEDDDSYSAYEQFLEDLFDAMDAVGGGPCMDDHDTDPHVSMARGVKFWSSTHMEEYAYNANLEVAVWQAMYPNGVVIGSSGYAAFPPGGGGTKQYVGYGNLYFFFDRANITTAFNPNRDLTSDEEYYATLTQGDVSSFYSSVTDVDFNYGGSGDGGGGDWEHNPYNWRASMAEHDFTDGWDLPPNCKQEGETFFGIPLSRSSDSKLQSTSTFQNSFDFDQLMDRNYTYVQSFGTNHGWLLGEEVDNAVGSIVDKDTAHIPIFYLGTTNANMVSTHTEPVSFVPTAVPWVDGRCVGIHVQVQEGVPIVESVDVSTGSVTLTRDTHDFVTLLDTICVLCPVYTGRNGSEGHDQDWPCTRFRDTLHQASLCVCRRQRSYQTPV